MWKNECKKFKPNIFNKNKCSNCYRDRDQHSDEALEVNKATRIVSKCGYLFVAPNWDFTNPIYRTKRWQRRWFVLYDDGELTYSVDDHYDTVPQAIINLNNVFEITEADAITGNENSIAIVANDGIHFCKGTCREESRMWLDILRLFPQATVMGQGRSTGNGGRAKRSATFPGMRNLGTNFMSPASRFANNKHAAAKAKEDANEEEEEEEEEDDMESQDEEEPEEISKPLVEKPPPSVSSAKIARRSSEKLSRRPSRISGQEDVGPPPPTPPNTSPPPSPSTSTSARPPPSPGSGGSMSKTSTASISLISSSVTPPHSRRASYHRPTLSSEYRSTRFATETSASLSASNSDLARRRPSSSSSGTPSRGSQSCLGLAALQSRNLQKKDSISSTESLSPSPSESRGTPDGCGLDNMIMSTGELLTKKGWLMKQGLTKEWHKYWFVLQDVALLYYRDPKAESKGFLDGIIDLSLVQGVDKTDLPRNFGFSVHTFEGKNIVFSAITDGIRNNWITCLRKAANLSSSNDNEKKIMTKRSSSFSDSPMTITTTKIVRSSTSNVLIPPKLPEAASKSLNIPKLTTTPSSSNEQEDDFDEEDDEDEDDESSDYDDEEDDDEEPGEDEAKDVKNAAGQDGVLVELLETEVDSLKAKLEMTQNELFTLHNSNLDLNHQLRKTQSQSSSSSTKYSFSSANSSNVSTVTSNSSLLSTKASSPAYDKSAYLDDELARTQKELAKQTSEIMSLKNQLSLKQITLTQHLQSLEDITKERDDSVSKLDKTKVKLEEATDKLAKQKSELEQVNQHCQELSQNFALTKESLEKEVSKWKILYESLYLQYDNELHAWEDSLSKLEKQRDDRESVMSDEIRRKDRVLSDLSEQLKESEDRIQELQIELEACKEANEALKHHNEESFSRLVVSMEEKFEETMKAEKEQMELAFKLKVKDHDLYDKLACSSPMTSRKTPSSSSRRASLVKISSMSDLMALKAPTFDSLELMAPDELKQKFVVLMDHFYAAVDEIRALRSRLSKAQDSIDTMEIDKLRFEESFKRTIVMQEQQENLMSKRIQDLTNKLLVSEKTVRQLKETRKHSRVSKSSILSSKTNQQQSDSAADQ